MVKAFAYALSCALSFFVVVRYFYLLTSWFYDQIYITITTRIAHKRVQSLEETHHKNVILLKIDQQEALLLLSP